MPYHDYTAKDALALLMRRIDDVSPIIARQIQSAIDTGKDLQVEEPTPAEVGKRRAKKRYFRKHAAYTDEQNEFELPVDLLGAGRSPFTSLGTAMVLGDGTASVTLPGAAPDAALTVIFDSTERLHSRKSWPKKTTGMVPR